MALSLKRNVGNNGHSCLESAFETFWSFPEHYRFLYILKNYISTCLSAENCDLGCAPAIFEQFSCFLPHSSVPVLGFTYREALEQLQNTRLCNACDSSLCLNDKPWKIDFRAFNRKWPRVFYAYIFNYA